MYNTNPIVDMLIISAVFITVWMLLIKFRRYFSHQRTLPSAPIPVKCALLWGGAVFIMCLGVLAFELLTTNNIQNVLAKFNSLNYFVLFPIAAAIGALYGLAFTHLFSENTLIPSLLNRSKVGLVLGIVLGIAFSLLSAFSLDMSYSISPGYASILVFAILYVLPVCIVIFTLVFGLLTPKNALLNKAVKPTK